MNAREQLIEKYRAVGRMSGNELMLHQSDALRLIEDCKRLRLVIVGLDFLKDLQGGYITQINSTVWHGLWDSPNPVEDTTKEAVDLIGDGLPDNADWVSFVLEEEEAFKQWQKEQRRGSDCDRAERFKHAIRTGVILQLGAVLGWWLLSSIVFLIVGLLFFPGLILAITPTRSAHLMYWAFFVLWALVQLAQVVGVAHIARTSSGGQRRAFMIVLVAGLAMTLAWILLYYVLPAFISRFYWWQV